MLEPCRRLTARIVSGLFGATPEHLQGQEPPQHVEEVGVHPGQLAFAAFGEVADARVRSGRAAARAAGPRSAGPARTTGRAPRRRSPPGQARGRRGRARDVARDVRVEGIDPSPAVYDELADPLAPDRGGAEGDERGRRAVRAGRSGCRRQRAGRRPRSTTAAPRGRARARASRAAGHRPTRASRRATKTRAIATTGAARTRSSRRRAAESRGGRGRHGSRRARGGPSRGGARPRPCYSLRRIHLDPAGTVVREPRPGPVDRRLSPGPRPSTGARGGRCPTRASAVVPVNDLPRRNCTTAALRPIVAIVPLSSYSNGSTFFFLRILEIVVAGVLAGLQRHRPELR